MIKRRWLVPVVILLALAVLFVLGRTYLPGLTHGNDSRAPSFSAATPDGTRKVAFPSDLKGKWVWLMFSGLT